jgi:Coenzyme PQQ synthesis protein D (PqqD)
VRPSVARRTPAPETYDRRVSEDELPKPAEGVVYRELDGESVLVHLGTNRIYALNETGSMFWSLLAEGDDRSTIRARLLEEFDIGPDDLDREIDNLLADLAGAGLVV